MPRLVVPILLPESSASRKPSISLWRSKSMCARSEMTRREESIFTPAFSRVSISLNIPGRWTTTPLPTTHLAFSLRMPEGTRWRAYFALVVVDGVARVGAALAPRDDVVLLFGSDGTEDGESRNGLRSRSGTESSVRRRPGRKPEGRHRTGPAPGFRFSCAIWRAIAHLGEDVDELPSPSSPTGIRGSRRRSRGSSTRPGASWGLP